MSGRQVTDEETLLLTRWAELPLMLLAHGSTIAIA